MRGLAPLVAAFGLAVGGGACFEPIGDGTCRSDRDCAESTCSNVGECASSTYRLRVAWTLRGAQANVPGACDGVAELELAVTDPSTGMDFGIRPVPCNIGSFLLDKMPPGYTVVSLSAYGSRGQWLTASGGTADPLSGTVNVDLRP